MTPRPPRVLKTYLVPDSQFGPWKLYRFQKDAPIRNGAPGPHVRPSAAPTPSDSAPALSSAPTGWPLATNGYKSPPVLFCHVRTKQCRLNCQLYPAAPSNNKQIKKKENLNKNKGWTLKWGSCRLIELTEKVLLNDLKDK